MMKKVFVVVPNWNGAEYLGECLKSLLSQSFESKIVVVDNGSTDGSVELIEKQFPEVMLLKQSKNHGFAGGVNIGLNYAMGQGAEYIALFNNDAVAEKSWLQNLVDVLDKNTKAGIATSKLMRDDRVHIDSTGDFYTIWGMPFPRGRNQKDTGQYDESEEVFGASGGASLYRTALLNEIGLFDDKFFAYFEDVDISFRAQLAGWRVIYEPKAIAYHRVGATSSKLGGFSRYHSTKNFFLLYIKNMPGYLFFKYLPFFIIQAVRLAASSLLRGGILAYLRGLAHFLWLLPYAIMKHVQINHGRKAKLKEIDKLLVRSRPPRIPNLPENKASK